MTGGTALLSPGHVAVYVVVAIATGGVILRPWRLPEAVWAVAGALVLVVAQFLPASAALAAVARGGDVYLFLTGMMLLAEVARQEKLFDWLAVHAVAASKGDGRRLFAIVYGVGTIVTTFLSNDATAVVLTPAVYAAARAAGAEPLPYLFVCAFIANAASFVLPISNPANLVIFGQGMPSLGAWLARFALPSALAIGATYAVLRIALAGAIGQKLKKPEESAPLGRGGAIAAGGIALTAIALTGASAAGMNLGLPTFACGALVALAAVAGTRAGAGALLRGVSWSVLPLVAGLFVLVAGLEATGLTRALAGLLARSAAHAPQTSAWASGLAAGFGANLVNNLPMGLFAASVAHGAAAPAPVTGALLVGVDLGPNLSVTGSLATILWLIAIRRDGENVGAWRFLRLGLAVMPPALLLALAGLLLPW